MKLSSAQADAIDRSLRPFTDLGGLTASQFIQEQILDPLESGPVGIEATAKDIDSIAKGGGSFSYDPDATSGLTFGFKAGRFHNGKTVVAVSAGTVGLSASATNYVEVDRSGTVSANTTSYTSGRLPLFTIVTGGSTISTITQSKTLMTLIGPNGTDGSMLSTPAATKEIRVHTVGTIGTAAGSTVKRVRVPTTVAAGSKVTGISIVPKDALATDNTNYIKFGVVNLGNAGAGTDALVDITAAANSTKTTGGSALVAKTPRNLTLVTLSIGTERDVNPGNVLEITITSVGTLSGTVDIDEVLIELAFTN